MWARGYSLLNIQHEVEICSEAAVNWASYCREICLLSYVDNPEQLGGEGKTVEIDMFMLRIILIKLFLDESKFGRRKFWRGHRVDGYWVFGGVERESGRVFMEVVEKRDADTLIPLLEKWVKKGSTVVSDCWKAYSNMQGYRHLTVFKFYCDLRVQHYR